MEKQGTLILICGLPGAGKTTLAKKLAKEREAARLCPDDWILAILKDQQDIVERDRLRDPMEQLLWRHAQRLLALGLTVILENGFWSKQERDGYRDYAKNKGIRVELYFVHADFDTLWQRVEKRNSNLLEFQITKKELEDGWQVFEPPTKEEGLSYDLFNKILELK